MAMVLHMLQVATRLPECGGVMFSFRTYLRPLKVLEKRTEVMQCLLAAFMALPEEVVSAAALKHCSASEQWVKFTILDMTVLDVMLSQALFCDVVCCAAPRSCSACWLPSLYCKKKW